MVVKEGDKVHVHYVGKFDDGEVFDDTEGKEPLEFTIGGGEVIEGFDRALIGMSEGESKFVKILPSEAYGEYNEELILAVDRSQFPEDMEVEPGQVFMLEPEDEAPVEVTVLKVEGDKVYLDANHPLAGEELNFELKLVKIL
ncbi:MAG: FKBP-type peptidyl-prolyl cis-trans isomerase [Chloroflexota bacterium]